nr:immunoglobulin heavy chain junction region [Macaca mulatta]MOX62470.1 immunoglobulin heavy chain junction region [Macaca mulatta]
CTRHVGAYIAPTGLRYFDYW